MKTLIPILMLSVLCAVHAADLEAETQPMIPVAGITGVAAPDTAGTVAVPPDPVSAEVHKAAAAGDGDAVRRLLYETPPEVNNRTTIPLHHPAVRKPSAAGPVLAVAGFAAGVIGMIMVSNSERKVQKTRTVDPCWGRLDYFWNGCQEQEYTETYTDTETDWGMMLIGTAGTVGGTGMFIGGMITIAARHPPKPRPTATGLPGREFSVAWTRSF